MKYRVEVSGRSYTVEIEDIHARPVIARVDGEKFEVHPDNRNEPEVQSAPGEPRPVIPSTQPASRTGSPDELTAPLPGTVLEIFVKAGDLIESGQVVLVIEAMKMKNSIRSTRAGRVAEILVDPGQTVTHKQGLVRFE